jgi:hypothetical protein
MFSPWRSASPQSWPKCREAPPCRAAGDQCWRRSWHAASTRLKLHDFEFVAFLIALCARVNTSIKVSNCKLMLVCAWSGAIQRIESVVQYACFSPGAILSW